MYSLTCVDHEVYPELFKLARVSPIYKKGSKSDVSNHRPISILCNLSKIFEKLYHSRLKYFFSSESLLSENQYGFRPGKNTEIAGIKLINRVLPALKNKSFAICVFLDFSACFDTLDRDLLFKKMYRYGVRGRSLNMLKSYFSERKQYVRYLGSDSSVLGQDMGVIQGSMNGPLCYDIYSNDIRFLCDAEEYILYADDTCLTYVGEDFERLVTHVNSRLSAIHEWCVANKLTLNPTKSEYLVVSNRTLPVVPRLFIGPDEVSRKEVVRYLGIMIDSRLKFYDHVEHVRGKLAQYLGVVRRLQNYFNLQAAKSFYYACVYSTIMYGISVWGGAINSTYGGSRLVILHEKIIRKLFTRFYGDSVFKNGCFLQLADVHRLRAALHMYKCLKTNQNSFVSDCVALEQASHSHQTRHHDRLMEPFPRVESVRVNYEYQFIHIWNGLPYEIRESESTACFKRSLKEDLLNMY